MRRLMLVTVIYSFLPAVADPSIANHRSIVPGFVAFSPNGKLLATGGGECPLKLWEVISGKQIRAFPERRCVGGVFFTPGSDEVIVSDGRDVSVLAVDGHRPPRVIAPKSAALALSPDGRLLACRGHDRKFLLLDASSGKQIRNLADDVGHHDTAVYSPDGQLLALAKFSGPIRLWQVETGKEIGGVPATPGSFGWAAFSPDSRTLASRHGKGESVALWDLATKKVKQEWPFRGVSAASFDLDGRRIALGAESTIEIRDVASGLTIRTLEGHSGFVTGLAFSPDGKTLASAGEAKDDPTVRLWDVDTGKQNQRLEVR